MLPSIARGLRANPGSLLAALVNPGHCLQHLGSFSTSPSSAASNDSGPSTACLDGTRAIVRITGPQAIQFLQGMVTNDMRPLEQPGAAPVYATLLTPKGKFLHDLIFYQAPSSSSQDASAPGTSLFMEVDARGKQNAIAWLMRYKLKRQLTIEDASAQYSVWAAYGPGTPASLQGWHADPRLPELGLRAVGPAGAGAPASGVPGAGQGSEEGYRAWRYRHGVAEGEIEIPREKAAPLDYNIDVLHGVSYKKGCYIGQERNSFTHYRGIIRKRAMPFTYEGGVPAVEEEVVGPKAGGGEEVVGAVRGVAPGGWGLGYLKLAPSLKAAAAAASGGAQGVALRGKASGARIVPVRPAWWLPEWGLEEGGEGGAE